MNDIKGNVILENLLMDMVEARGYFIINSSIVSEYSHLFCKCFENHLYLYNSFTNSRQGTLNLIESDMGI